MNLFKSTDMLRKLIFLSSISALLLALVAFAGCNRTKENSLEEVLEMAGSNRQNLENVLRYFENDSAGLAAAEFLIRKMPLHVSYRDTMGLGRLNIAGALWRILKGKWIQPHHYGNKHSLFSSVEDILSNEGKQYMINFCRSAA